MKKYLLRRRLPVAKSDLVAIIKRWVALMDATKLKDSVVAIEPDHEKT